MAVNLDKPDRWKQDIARSMDMYNDWFLQFAPETYRVTRVQTTEEVRQTLEATNNLSSTLYNFGPVSAYNRPLVSSTAAMPGEFPRARCRAGMLKNVHQGVSTQLRSTSSPNTASNSASSAFSGNFILRRCT